MLSHLITRMPRSYHNELWSFFTLNHHFFQTCSFCFSQLCSLYYFHDVPCYSSQHHVTRLRPSRHVTLSLMTIPLSFALIQNCILVGISAHNHGHLTLLMTHSAFFMLLILLCAMFSLINMMYVTLNLLAHCYS